jgi:DNA-directed RNA polymerase subunit RPC12/RpoP
MDTVTQTANCEECGSLIREEDVVIYYVVDKYVFRCADCATAYDKTEQDVIQGLKNLSTFFDDLPPAS